MNLTLNISTESFPFTSYIQHGNPPYLDRVAGKFLLDGDALRFLLEDSVDRNRQNAVEKCFFPMQLAHYAMWFFTSW